MVARSGRLVAAKRKPKAALRGRPPATGTTRSTPILVRLTPDEREAMQRAADAAGEPLASWVRAVAMLAVARGIRR